MVNMKSLIRLNDFCKKDILEIFKIADDIQKGWYSNFLCKRTVVAFFPNSSIRTRVTFEKGVFLLSGQMILFPPETLDKKEEIKDVIGYLNNWADVILVRHKDIHLLDQMRYYSTVPIINAMTDNNHPCEIISDLYALSKIRSNFLQDKYLFFGTRGNIGYAWREAAEVLDISLSQCCPTGYEIEGIRTDADIHKAIVGKDIIITDSLPRELLDKCKDNQITKEIMDKANEGAVINPCPPFYRGEEVSQDVIDSNYFVGYHFKKYLLEIQQAIIIFSMTR
jgi:ornithine carbamoyltransferase